MALTPSNSGGELPSDGNGPDVGILSRVWWSRRCSDERRWPLSRLDPHERSFERTERA